MRKTFTMLLFSMTSILPMAAQSDKSMVVETKNSGTQQFNLSDIRRLDFSNEGVSVVSVDKDGATFAFDDIKKITFGSATNGISQIKTGGRRASRFLSRATATTSPLRDGIPHSMPT